MKQLKKAFDNITKNHKKKKKVPSSIIPDNVSINPMAVPPKVPHKTAMAHVYWLCSADVFFHCTREMWF